MSDGQAAQGEAERNLEFRREQVRRASERVWDVDLGERGPSFPQVRSMLETLSAGEETTHAHSG